MPELMSLHEDYGILDRFMVWNSRVGIEYGQWLTRHSPDQPNIFVPDTAYQLSLSLVLWLVD